MPKDDIELKYDFWSGTITAGDLTFDKGGHIGDFLWSYTTNKDYYEQRALELMEKHNAFFSQYEEIAKVTRGSLVSCDHGSFTKRLNIEEDHGITGTNGEPVLTTKDNKVDSNISSFGTCDIDFTACDASLPRPTDFNCYPILKDKWITDTKNPLIWNQSGTGGDFEEVLDSEAYAVCLYGGLITIKEVPEGEVEGEAVAEENESPGLVTLEDLDRFGFYIGADDAEREAGLEELNSMLQKYGITGDDEIAFFMGQVAHETGKGARTLEKFNGSDPETYFNNKYGARSNLGNTQDGDGQLFRGGGYLNLTGRANYENFSAAMEDDRILTEGYKIVGGVYNRPIKDIKPGELGVIDVGEYAWESAAWFWTAGTGVDLNTYVATRDWKAISEAINENDNKTFSTRNKYINEFYEILTGVSLGLPE